MRFSTPILFLVFNRPETTKVVFEQIRNIRPEFLYIAADGPRSGNTNDIVKCTEVRKVVSAIDWPCHVTTLFRNENLGCKIAVSGAITWFFEQVDEGIILEDDILPNPSFFHFCKVMIEHYRDVEEVMHITGFNIMEIWNSKKQSYHFSYFGSIWGWASWKRAWQHYDVNIKQWEDAKLQERMLTMFFPKKMREQKKQLYNDLYDDKINTWDYQWTLCRLFRNGKCIIPSKNLVENIGFKSDATHTFSTPIWKPSRTYTLQTPTTFRNEINIDKKYDLLHLTKTSHIEVNSQSWFLKSLLMIKSIVKKSRI